jgi:uncharacterized repeat protein (TIGR03803 family)
VGQKKFWFTMSGVLAVLAVALLLPVGAGTASKYKVLHRFKGHDGANPDPPLIFDAAGNLFGTTFAGGDANHGTVFELTPQSDGSWTESVLYSFTGDPDGKQPLAGLIFDTGGNLYGTTSYGGGKGWGTVFKLTPQSDGSWTESVLYNFTGHPDAGRPWAGLIFDTAGNLYGTAENGGTNNSGAVFKLTPNSGGTWTESVVYSFSYRKGRFPQAGLIVDPTGNLYGTTPSGGVCDICGTVFKLTPQADGSWKASLLYGFRLGADGYQPLGGLILDPAGNLYGTTSLGGNLSDCSGFGCGVVFRLAPKSDGSWKYHKLHEFGANPGANPFSSLVFDAAGDLYGCAVGGPANSGVVYKLSPTSNGKWTFSVLHLFLGKPAAGANGLVLDIAGNLYGTTGSCGSGYNCKGVGFEITP